MGFRLYSVIISKAVIAEIAFLLRLIPVVPYYHITFGFKELTEAYGTKAHIHLVAQCGISVLLVNPLAFLLCIKNIPHLVGSEKGQKLTPIQNFFKFLSLSATGAIAISEEVPVQNE